MVDRDWITAIMEIAPDEARRLCAEQAATCIADGFEAAVALLPHMRATILTTAAGTPGLTPMVAGQAIIIMGIGAMIQAARECHEEEIPDDGLEAVRAICMATIEATFRIAGRRPEP